MKRALFLAGSLGAIVCLAAATLRAQAGAPTQRVHIPGIPDGTSIYPTSTERGDKFISTGCISKSANGEFIISDWRGAAKEGPAGAPPSAATASLLFRLEGNPDMLKFQVGHNVQVEGPVIELAKGSTPAKMKVESILYLSRTCWERGTTTPQSASPKP